MVCNFAITNLIGLSIQKTQLKNLISQFSPLVYPGTGGHGIEKLEILVTRQEHS